jgi:flagellar hook-associated protein FlgK
MVDELAFALIDTTNHVTRLANNANEHTAVFVECMDSLTKAITSLNERIAELEEMHRPANGVVSYELPED